MFLLEFTTILLFAKIGGLISKKFNQPEVLGEIIVGILLGPTIFNVISMSQTFSDFAQIGVILLMFIAGLETDINEMKASGKCASLIALGGVFIPFILSIIASKVFGFSTYAAVFIGVISTATSVSISVQTLREINKLKSKEGMSIISAAIIDDIIGIIMLTIVVALINPDTSDNLLLVILKITFFFIIIKYISKLAIAMLNKYTQKVIRNDLIITVSLIFCFALAFIAEEFGVAAITGAYFAGIAISQCNIREKVFTKVQSITYSVFTPIFFASIGLKANLTGFSKVAAFSIVFLILAFIGKILGSGLMAKLSGFSARQSLQVGVGMVPRAEVALIVTDIGMRIGAIDESIFATIILMVIATSLLTPMLLKKSFA